MSTYFTFSIKSIIFFAYMGVLAFAMGLPVHAQVSADIPASYEFMLEKNISDNRTDNPYTADQFSFHVTGNGVDETVSLTEYTAATAKGSVFLPMGEYTVTEVGPGDFAPEDWTVQWSGYGCENKNSDDLFTGMTVYEDDSTANVCRADNQWRGEPSEVLCADDAANNTGEAFPCTYDPPELCTDDAASNTGQELPCVYPPELCTDDDAMNVGQPLPCTYGEDTYLIEGYVWHDENENGEIDEGEEYLEDWEIEIDNGSTTKTTLSDQGGYYSFHVSEGTWTLSETVMGGWAQVFPLPTSYVIEVPGDELAEVGTLKFPLSLFFSFAHAATVGGPYNFGNVLSGGGGGDGGDGGGSTTLSCSLGVSASTANSGETVVLQWITTGASSTSIDNGIGEVAATGTLDVQVVNNILYTLTAINDSATTTCSAGVSVNSSTGSSRGGGGGSRLVSCELFEVESSGGGTLLKWETRQGSDLEILANGSVIHSETDNDIVEKGSYVTNSNAKDFELIVSSGSRKDTCLASLGGPVSRVLGEQVSLVPQGAAGAGAGGSTSVPTHNFVYTVIPIGILTRKSTFNA